MDIVVSGRNVEVPDHYRAHVADKLSRIEKFDHKLIRISVELQHEPNRRQADICQHVEITCKSRGPVIRAEACDSDFYSALDAAVSKLEARLRRAADRRRVHYGQRRRPSVADAVPQVGAVPAEALGGMTVEADREPSDATPEELLDGRLGAGIPDDEPGRIVRYKEHSAAPMSVDQALHEMELVGHDFYLFADAETGLPSVVYRRRGYAYGVIRLGTSEEIDGETHGAGSHSETPAESADEQSGSGARPAATNGMPAMAEEPRRREGALAGRF